MAGGIFQRATQDQRTPYPLPQGHPSDSSANTAGHWLADLATPTSLDAAARRLTELDDLLTRQPASTRKKVMTQVAQQLPNLRLETFGEGTSPSILADPETGQLWQHGQRIFKSSPSRIRWRFAYHMLRYRGQKRADIFPEVWEQAYRPPSSDNAMHVNLYRLRKQLENTELVFEVDDQSRYLVRGNPSLWIWDPSVKSEAERSTDAANNAISESHIPAATDPFFGVRQVGRTHSLLERDAV